MDLEKLRYKHSREAEEIKELKNRVVNLEKLLDAVTPLKNPNPATIAIAPTQPANKSESIAVAVWSDHHLEEKVMKSQTLGRNEYNLDIARQRFDSLVTGTLAWYRIEAKETKIKTFVLALLGDFITGNIHNDSAESNLLPPTEAIYFAQSLLLGGIRTLLDELPTDVKIQVVCHGGNHSRITKEQRIATEVGNNLEYLMYLTIRDFFDGNKRIEFNIAKGYHSHMSFFEDKYVIRFHHGHQISYSGGLSGLHAPVQKAIANWNRARFVDLDVFGHFHQRIDGGNFILNGSLVGYNAYATSIKAAYERPSQTFFLINREYCGKSMTAAIYV